MLKELARDLSAMSVFAGILKDETVSAMVAVFSDPSAENCGRFVRLLYQHTDDLTDHLLNVLSEDENCFMMLHAKMREIPAVIDKAAHAELKLIERASRVTHAEVAAEMTEKCYLAEWNVHEADLTAFYANRMSELMTVGYGIFAKYHSFMFRDGRITPVKNPDPQRLSQLSGYENERRKVIENTLALLNGKPAANVLLYGDAGTGKSSTVKAVLNEYKDRGLRLIELKKSQLHDIPLIISEIADNPLKFILYVDDLSFSSDDDDFGALKAVLEGSVASKTPNIAIYATSNRRHLVKERFSDRSGDEIHVRDSREELISLSERFGLKVTFTKPDKELYLKIVEQLAQQYGLDCDKDELFAKAESFALRRSGRSGRAARQFIEMVISGQL